MPHSSNNIAQISVKGGTIIFEVVPGSLVVGRSLICLNWSSY